MLLDKVNKTNKQTKPICFCSTRIHGHGAKSETKTFIRPTIKVCTSSNKLGKAIRREESGETLGVIYFHK